MDRARRGEWIRSSDKLVQQRLERGFVIPDEANSDHLRRNAWGQAHRVFRRGDKDGVQGFRARRDAREFSGPELVVVGKGQTPREDSASSFQAAEELVGKRDAGESEDAAPF